jgi:protein ImuB
MLWVAVLLPSLPLEVYARAWPTDAPRDAFVVDSGGRDPRIVAGNAAAIAAGVRPGMPLAAALALAPGLVRQPRDVDGELRALEQLATFALRFTPMTCLVPPAAFVADIGGSLRLFGGRDALLARLARGIERRGYAARLAVAPTPQAALACARAGRAAPVESLAALAAALAPLPLAHFDLPDDARATLAAAGVHTFGEAERLPRAGLARRFGPAFVATLDHASGRRADPRVPFEPPPRFATKLELPAPVHDVEALAFAVNRLVHELAAWLLARGLGVVAMTLALAHERALVRQHGSPCTLARFALGAPSRTPPHLNLVLRERLARIALPAPVAGLALASEAVAPLAGHNFGLLPGDAARAVDVPLVDRLRARLGEDAVKLAAPAADHRPEHAMRIATVGDTDDAAPPAKRRGRSSAQATAPLPSAPRPLWLLSAPQPLTGLLDARPWVLREGPERIESGWWDGADVRRDYYVAESPAGEVAWIFRDHRRGTDDGEWFLHGLFA